MKGVVFSEFLSSVTERGRALLGWKEGAPEAGSEDLPERCEILLLGRGEATGMAIAQDVLNRFSRLDEAGRLAFFFVLAERFGVDQDNVRSALEIWHREPTDLNAAALHFASEPRRQELLRRLNRAPGGTAALVEMRTVVLRNLRDHPELEALDRDFHHLFSSWFNRGFLVLRRIDWSTPATILDKIIQYEAVHEICDWDDLRHRIDPPDRRCYAFFHPALRDEPLIFVEVALTKGMPDAIVPVLSTVGGTIGAEEADTAVFYSISNCQEGLRGVSFGSFLIKQVVDELAGDLPAINRFVTLSPVPGFMSWLKSLQQNDPENPLGAVARAALNALDDANWAKERATQVALKRVLLPLAAHYFVNAKTPGGEPVDPVARFHLGNGARLERINWLADTSEKGLLAGAGMMVNYLYELKSVERNHEAYANDGQVITSAAVGKLLKGLAHR